MSCSPCLYVLDSSVCNQSVLVDANLGISNHFNTEDLIDESRLSHTSLATDQNPEGFYIAAEQLGPLYPRRLFFWTPSHTVDLEVCELTLVGLETSLLVQSLVPIQNAEDRRMNNCTSRICSVITMKTVNAKDLPG